MARRSERGFAEGWRAAVHEAAISFAVNHPVRLDCLAILIERVASPKEIAEILEIETPAVDSHVKELFVDGVVELVGTEEGGDRRGGKEHFYRARVRPEISDEELARMPRGARREMAGCILGAIVTLGLSALRHGAMDEDDNLHIAWKVVPTDAEGDKELAELLAELLERVEAIRRRNEARAADGEAELTPRIVASLGFVRGKVGSLVELGTARKESQWGRRGGGAD